MTVVISRGASASESLQVDARPSFNDAVSVPPTEVFSRSVASVKGWPHVEWSLRTDSVLSLVPGVKSGGDGKADMEGTVDIDDVACEVPRERFSSRLAYELAEFREPRTGDGYNDDGPVGSFI